MPAVVSRSIRTSGAMLTAPVLVCSGRRMGTNTGRTRRLRTFSFESFKLCLLLRSFDCRITGSHPPSRCVAARRKLGSVEGEPMNSRTLHATALSTAASLDELYPRLAERSIGAGWNKPEPAMWPQPKKNFVPFHWHYSDAAAAFEVASRLVSTEQAERRNLILVNPVAGNIYSTLRTLVVAYQSILPGETARSHRHSPNALRLVLDAGGGAYTTVNAKQIPMHEGDVVLTPSGSWHGHGHDGDRPATWIDYLDVRLVQLLEPVFFELHPAGI